MSRKGHFAFGVRSATAALAASLALLVIAPTAAHAELDTPISGTTSSDNDRFYLSANLRYITTDLYAYGLTGYAQLNIDSAPKLSNGTTPDVLKWRFYVNGSYTSVFHLYQNPAAWTTSPFIGYPNQAFRNSFARDTDCPNCNHNFSGNMNY